MNSVRLGRDGLNSLRLFTPPRDLGSYESTWMDFDCGINKTLREKFKQMAGRIAVNHKEI